jgi:hypothetical protein
MPTVVEAVKEAGKILLRRFSPEAHPGNLAGLLAGIRANDEASSRKQARNNRRKAI